MRRIAYDSRELWIRWAPFASGSFLAKNWPASRGGLSVPGWQGALTRAKSENPDLPWLPISSGQKPKFTDPLPEPVWLDEVAQDDSSLEILATGDYRSTKLLRLNDAQSKDPDYLLTAHGFDPCEWELVTAKNSMYQMASRNAEGDGHDISTLYSSRITAKPLKARFDIEAIAATLAKVRPLKVTPPKSVDGGMLELGFHDLHFGVSTIDTYAGTLERTAAFIRRQKWARILIPVGSDLFHNDNFRHTTAKGTPIEGMDWTQAWADAATFYGTLIAESLSHSADVHLVYVKGNHDESMSWAFCQMIAARYPQLVSDLRIVERKCHTWEGVCVGLTHGNKGKHKDLDRIFGAEFPEFNGATVKEIHTGHEHHEVTEDRYGVLVRKAPSGNVTDTWHATEGFVGAVKRFLLYAYYPDSIDAMKYV